MEQAIKLTRKQAKKAMDVAFPDYKGRKISLIRRFEVECTDQDWSGGTHSDYCVMHRDGFEFVPSTFDYKRRTVRLDLNTMVVERSWFCGKEIGVAIYAHPTLFSYFLGDGHGTTGEN